MNHYINEYSDFVNFGPGKLGQKTVGPCWQPCFLGFFVILGSSKGIPYLRGENTFRETNFTLDL